MEEHLTFLSVCKMCNFCEHTSRIKDWQDSHRDAGYLVLQLLHWIVYSPAASTSTTLSFGSTSPPPFCVRALHAVPLHLVYPPHLSAIKSARRYFISQNYCGLDDISDHRDRWFSPHCWLAQFLKQSSCFITSTWSLLSLFPYRDRPPAFCCALRCQSFLVQTFTLDWISVGHWCFGLSSLEWVPVELVLH